MCTVTFMPRRDGYCLGMNRDEKRSRPKGLPPAERNIHGRLVVYPSEPDGGTWIASNNTGASLALINWYSATARTRANTISRGKIIPSLCTADTAALVHAGLAAIPLDRINPFRLIGVFPSSKEIIEWRWDLKELIRKDHRWRAQQWISSGFDESAAQKSRNKVFKQAQAQKSVETIGWLRRLHRSHLPLVGPFSTCMHRDDAATVSYTEISVRRGSATMRHICGPPCNGAVMASLLRCNPPAARGNAKGLLTFAGLRMAGQALARDPKEWLNISSGWGR